MHEMFFFDYLQDDSLHTIEKGQKVTFNFPSTHYGEENDLAFKVTDMDTGEDITKGIL